MLLVVFAIQGRTVVVFPRFLRFFLHFLSEVEGVFPHFFVETHSVVVGYLFFVAMYLRQYVVRLTPFACWRVPFFVRVPRRQYVVAPGRVTNENANTDIR